MKKWKLDGANHRVRAVIPHFANDAQGVTRPASLRSIRVHPCSSVVKICSMKLTEMRELLAKRDIQLTKSLGQNFLHDLNQLRRIVAAAKLTPADKVLEIGPGLGPLTELLLAGAGEVLAIEKDARLVEILRDRFKTDEGDEAGDRVRELPPKTTDTKPRLNLLHADALEYLRREPRDWHDWKLVSNLPYSVASPLLVELAQTGRPPKRIVATLQN